MILPLIDKKILFFSPKFHDYDQVIKDELERLGAYVVMYDERPSTKSVVKAIIRINPKFLNSFSRKYYLNILEKEKNIDFDYIFIIKGEAISSQIIHLMKEYFNKSKLIFYTWDSLRNVRYTNKKIHLFDKTFSFDRNDCEVFNNVSYLPLFYSTYYEPSNYVKKLGSHRNDLIFIASLHSDRYKVFRRIIENAKQSKPNISVYSFLFYPSKLFFLLRKVFDKNFFDTPFSDIKWFPLSQDEVVKNIYDSDIVIDINHPKQSGLTMRTIECIALKKKLITTNKNIRDESFYNDANILIIDRKKPCISHKFIETPYEKIDDHIVEQYSIKSWVSTIFL